MENHKFSCLRLPQKADKKHIKMAYRKGILSILNVFCRLNTTTRYDFIYIEN